MPDTGSFYLQEEFLITGAAVNGGLFDKVRSGPQTIEDLIAFSGSDHRTITTIVDALVALGYFEYEAASIKLSREAISLFYDKESPDYIGFYFMHTYHLIPRWLKLSEMIIPKGQNTQDQQWREEEHFIRAMDHYARDSAPATAELCLKGLPSQAHILDIGGGPLTYAKEFAKRGAIVKVLDLPHVVDMMQPELNDPTLDIKMIKGDFTQGLPEGSFHMLYLGNICHIYGETENRELFTDSFARLKAGGIIIINDFIRGTGPEAAIFAVNMLVNTSSGGTWTFEQYSRWLTDAGFQKPEFVEVEDNQLIIAKKQ